MKSNGKIHDVRKELPFGAIAQIAKRSNVTYQTVTRVLNGKSENRNVKIALTEFIKEMNETNQAFNNVSEEFLNSVSV